MGFHWDTLEFWVRSEIDEMLRDVADADVIEQRSGFERNRASYYGGHEMAAESQTRRRVAVGVHFWPPPEITTPVGPHGPLPVFTPRSVAIDEDEIPW